MHALSVAADPGTATHAPHPAVTTGGHVRDEAACTAAPRRRAAWLVTAGFALLLAVAMPAHEMWRDEIQAWLLARDAPTWWGVLRTIRYEGHPGLWHLLLWPVAQWSWNPAWMQAVHALVASAAVWVLVRHSPLWLPFRVALPFGYVLCFEWGVISRNYALSALLLFLFCTAHSRRWRAFPLAALALAAACHTNVHALILVIVLTPLLMIEYAVAVAGRWRLAERNKIRVCAGFLLVLTAIATAIVQIRPPADSGFASGWRLDWDAQHAARAGLTLLRAHVPIPEHSDRRFWNSSRAAGHVLRNSRDAGEMLRRSAVVLAVALCVAIVLLWRRPWFLVHWTLGTAGLMTFFYIKYMGSMRHHAFHWLWAVVVLWMALDHPPWLFGRRTLDRLAAGAE